MLMIEKTTRDAGKEIRKAVCGNYVETFSLPTSSLLTLEENLPPFRPPEAASTLWDCLLAANLANLVTR